jgi:hypothetical protein
MHAEPDDVAATCHAFHLVPVCKMQPALAGSAVVDHSLLLLLLPHVLAGTQ